MPKKKVLMAMSGGVDSSVGAALLQQQGYDVVGVFMRLGSPGETLDQLEPLTDSPACEPVKVKLGHQGCCSVSDAADARLVAAQLNVPFYVVNFKKDFGRIMDYFADEYANGRTPNPCVRCNDWLKFGKLHQYAQQINADFVASGHYAQIQPDQHTNQPSLLRGQDHDKDQSYVLFGVPREKLPHMLLPVGALRKTEVRAIAESLNLPVFNKPDSQEICFVPDNNYAAFVAKRLGDSAPQSGTILDELGNPVGTHQGHHHFTIGQRRGVGVALGYPIFVTSKNPQTNTITVGPRQNLLTTSCTVGEMNWLAETLTSDTPIRAMVKFRYNSDAVPATVIALEDLQTEPSPSGRTGKFFVRFDNPQEAVTPGQAAVVYNEQNCRVLGGGWILSTSI